MPKLFNDTFLKFLLGFVAVLISSFVLTVATFMYFADCDILNDPSCTESMNGASVAL